MGRDLTTSSANRQDSENTPLPRASWHPGAAALPNAARLLAALALGALLLALAYQIPITHTVDIGGYDAAYVQGFFDPERDAGADHPELAGSDGSARWTRATSYLLFPQAGLPAQLTLRLRGWREAGLAPNVQVLLNGTTVLGQFRAGAEWEEHTFQINGGLLKPNDVVIEIRSETAHISTDDPREVGLLLDRAMFHSGPAPITPYPAQLLYGALAAGMAYILIMAHREPRTGNQEPENQRTREPRTEEPGMAGRRVIRESLRQGNLERWFPRDRAWLHWLLSVLVLSSGFLVLYRSQPPYPYPLLRLLPMIDGVLAAGLAIRYGPKLARRVPALPDMVAVGGIGAWTAAVLVAAQGHVVLSVPGPEKDFGVFARRSAHLAGAFPSGINDANLDGVLRADGFYNLGYPLLLWLARPFTSDNPFLAGRLIAALSAALLLVAGWWLARQLLGRSGALLALLMLAFSPLVVQYALYIGTDMPFAAVCTLALTLLVHFGDWRLEITEHKQSPISNLQSPIVIAAGIAAGAAFLIRHPGLLLLPLGWLMIWLLRDHSVEARSQNNPQKLKFSILNSQFSILVFTLAFLLTISPQLYVNVRDTGSPLFNQQAKNVWQGVFGDGDWGRWGATANDITLVRVIAQDPARFLANWWANVRGFFGTGGEDTREFGQAAQLRLLGFPANWLAITGLLGWIFLGFQQLRQGDKETRRQRDKESYSISSSPLLPLSLSLLAWVALYVLAISVGLAPQARFFLPLTPIYALAAAWAITFVQPVGEKNVGYRTRAITHNFALIAGVVLLVLLWGGFASGTAYVTRTRTPSDDNAPGQPADEVAAATLVLQTLRANERLVLRPPQGSLDGLSLGKYSAIADRVIPAPSTDDLAALQSTGAGYLLRATTLEPAPGGLTVVGSAGGYTLYTIPR